ncbi:MAG: vitamin 1,25-hydroxylase [Pseudonocardiales bacterium]|nr:vitamin 1,25-hydroxylase [Pseudonocardiales bacterium]
MTATGELFGDAFWRDPYPTFALLRAEAPVRRVDLADGPVWLVTRYDDVRAALGDPRLSKNWRYLLPPEARATAPGDQDPMMLLRDPPDHTRLRTLVSRSFTARRIAALRPRVAEIAAELLDAVPVDAPFDLMAHYAFPLPVQVICELLGVPLADRDRFGAWSRVLIDQSSPADAQDADTQLHAYLAELIARKRAEPDDALLSALARVADESGDRLSELELVAMATLLLIAGHETTTNLVGNAVLALLTHPDQLALLRARPELMPRAVEEFLRFDGPVWNATYRFTTEDVEIGGVTIPAASAVQLTLGSANRDDARFPDAAELRIDRDAGGHVAFGHGIHFCLGAPLARIEGDVALSALLTRFPTLQLAADPAELVFRRSTLVRGLQALPVRAEV